MLLKVIIVEDSEDDFIIMVEALLRGGYDLVYKRVETPEEMGKALRKGEWDLVISDYSMPRFSGLEALKVLKNSSVNVPFILISGNAEEKDVEEVMEAGAQCFISKDNITKLSNIIRKELARFPNKAI